MPILARIVYAILFPRPVFRKALEKKNAMTMSHMALEEKPTKISDGVKVFVIEIRHKPIIQTAPIGNGRVIKPTIIAKNMRTDANFVLSDLPEEELRR